MTTRRFFAPEVIQTSAMDCGPASLKCLLEGYGTPVSYGRLREACQTDVDGASIDTLEDIARQLGLEAQQVMLPPDHLLLEESNALPALVVMRMPGGDPHFVVLWRMHGPIVQLMDPATGRRWTTATRFLDDCYIHHTNVPGATWRAWAGSSAALAVLRRRLQRLGGPGASADVLIRRASDDPGWRTLGALDAATRMTASLVEAGGVAHGSEAESIVVRLFDDAVAVSSAKLIPDQYWTVAAAPALDGTEQIQLRGAVLVTVRAAGPASAALSPELRAALDERPTRPDRELLTLLAADGVFAPLSLVAALALAAGGILLEALLFRGFFDLGRELGLSGQRLGAIGLAVAFLGLLLALEFPLAAMALRMGRHLECRLRLAFLRKIPRLGDLYFRSRLRSDMSERSHGIYRIRRLPDLGAQWLRFVFELVLTAAAIAWLDAEAAPLAVLSAAVALLVPLAVQPLLIERDLRVRTHLGALGRYYLDSLLGLRAIRCHGAERPIRREHEGLVVEWTRAGFRLQRLAVTVEALQLSLGLGLSMWLLFDHLSRHREVGGVLLLTYWALNLPLIGQEIGQLTWQYPGLRNSTLRLLEPLGAPEQEPPATGRQPLPIRTHGIAIQMRGVGVRAAGHAILDDISVDIPAGAHVAVIGASGAGKSTLVGLMLGWHRVATGCVLVDGQPIEHVGREALCRSIAWVDPAVHLWNRSALDNLCYGSRDGSVQNVGTVIDAANLVKVLQTMPEGLQTLLGENGARVSGGEGQRVRLARAALRQDVRLAILDEPFRGLEREERRKLLGRARRLWDAATLFCSTHDISETLAFDRVLVVEGGRIVEDGPPSDLAARPDSRYRSMLDEEAAVQERLWGDATGAPASDGAADRGWRRLRLIDGVLVEHSATEAS